MKLRHVFDVIKLKESKRSFVYSFILHPSALIPVIR
jgi:hypothetical protein